MGLKKASEGGGIVWCHDSGNRCTTFADDEKTGPSKPEFLFARADQSSPVYDAALDELSGNLNGLVKEAQVRGREKQGKGSEMTIGFLLTGAGFLPVWKRVVGDTERLEDLVDIESLTDLEAMTDDQLNAYLDISLEDRGFAGTWFRHSESGGLIRCRGAGKSCFVTALEPQEVSPDATLISNYFPTVEQDSPVYDPALHELTVKLNDLVNQTQARERQESNRDPRAQIGLVITGHGLLPAWKIVLSDADDYGDDPDSVDLDAMTDAQRDQYLRVKS